MSQTVTETAALPPTTRLDHAEPSRLAFTARVLAHATHGGNATVVLDRSSFYPESGGQLADHGTLGETRVTDVQIDDAGLVHHRVDGPRPDVGTVVHGAVDGLRRRQFAAQHTAQHMLSRALLDLAEAETVSSRLGEDACTVDLRVPTLDEGFLARAESLVNDVVGADVPVRAFFPDPPVLSRLPLRRAPKVASGIRVVEVEGFDVSPCGGTHCTRSSQIGMVQVTGLERYKGMIRVHFTAGDAARNAHLAWARALGTLARTQSCGIADLPGVFARVQRELDDARTRNRALSEKLAAHAATALAQTADERGRIVAVLEGADRDFLRAVGAALTASQPVTVFLACAGDGGLDVLLARGPGSTVDCGSTLRALAQQCGGRGGGKPDRAEGRVPAGTDWRALVA